METGGAGEFVRHFSGPRHWQADVTYRVHQGLPVFNKLMDPLELSESQRSNFLSRPFKDKSEGYSFPEDLLPSCTRVDSVVPPSAVGMFPRNPWTRQSIVLAQLE